MSILQCFARGLTITTLALIACITAIDPSIAVDLEPTGPTDGRTLVIGKVSSNPKKQFRNLKPIAQYVAQQMKDLGITGAKVLMAKDNQQMITYLKQGKVDWVTETVSSALLFQEHGSAEILLRNWRKGVPEYHTIFFARKDSAIDSLEDLNGRTIAFQDRGSTTAYFLPAAQLIEHGLVLFKLTSLEEQAPHETVGYVFSREEINTSTWVHSGLIDAGAYNNLDWSREDHLPSRYKKDLKIFHKSAPQPRALELVRKSLDPAIKTRLKSILLNAHRDVNAKAALQAYQQTQRFDELDENVRAALKKMRHRIRLVQSRLF